VDCRRKDTARQHREIAVSDRATNQLGDLGLVDSARARLAVQLFAVSNFQADCVEALKLGRGLAAQGPDNSLCAGVVGKPAQVFGDLALNFAEQGHIRRWPVLRLY